MAKRSNKFLFCAASFALFTSHAAFAADSSLSYRDKAVEDSEGAIVVTAQRREQKLQDVPISVAVVSGERLADRSVNTFESLAPLVPSLTVEKSPLANIIVMRGIGSAPGSPSLDQSVVMFVDGIYAGNSRQFAAPFLDVERIEVLRGPQGALVGRNTSAGAINVITVKPKRELGGFANANYNFTLKGPTIDAGLNLPITDNLAVRAVGSYAHQDGYIFNTGTGRKDPTVRNWTGRITAAYGNGGPLSATLKYEHGDSQTIGIVVQPLASGHNNLFNYDYKEVIDNVKSTKLNGRDEVENLKTDVFVGTLNMEFGGMTLSSISGYSAFNQSQTEDSDFTLKDISDSEARQNFRQYSQEFRLLSPSGQTIEYSLGAYYSHSNLHEERANNNLPNLATSTFRRFTQTDDVVSLYGQLTWRITDQLRFNGSARWTHQEKSARYLRMVGALAPSQQIGTTALDFGDQLNNGRIDPAFSIQYDVAPNAMLYSSFSKGSKSAGFQGAIANATVAGFGFLPETSTAYEAGLKVTLPRVGYVNLAAFYTIYKNLQVTAIIALPGNNNQIAFFTGNAPKATVGGLEAEFSLKAAKFLTFNGSLSWLPKASYSSFKSGPCYPLAAATGTLPGSCDLTGARLGFAPRFAGSATAALEMPVGDNLAFQASISPTFRSSSYRDFAVDPQTVQGGFVKLDASIGVGAEDGKWNLALLVKNLTDKQTIGFASSAGGAAAAALDAGARIISVDLPRTWAVVAKVRF